MMFNIPRARGDGSDSYAPKGFEDISPNACENQPQGTKSVALELMAECFRSHAALISQLHQRVVKLEQEKESHADENKSR